MMTTVLLLLQTTKCSGFFGKRMTELTASSLPNALKVETHSVVFSDHILTLPSDEALEFIARKIMILIRYFSK